eukprot:3424184-Rhodomonas_salina.1
MPCSLPRRLCRASSSKYEPTTGRPGPGCYGTFANGRVEHFLQGYRTMNYHDIGELENAKMIAREMARVHKWHAEEIVAFDGSKEPVLFSQIWKWHDQAVAVDPASFEPEVMKSACLQLEHTLRHGFCKMATTGWRMKKLEIFKAKDELTFLEKSIPEGCKTAFCSKLPCPQALSAHAR